MKDNQPIFGSVLVTLRGIVSRNALAKALAVSVPYLRDVEMGRRGPLSPPMIARCGDVLRLKPDEVEALYTAAARDRVARGGGVKLVVNEHNADVAEEIGRLWPRLSAEQCARLCEMLKQLVC